MAISSVSRRPRARFYSCDLGPFSASTPVTLPSRSRSRSLTRDEAPPSQKQRRRGLLTPPVLKLPVGPLTCGAGSEHSRGLGEAAAAAAATRIQSHVRGVLTRAWVVELEESEYIAAHLRRRPTAERCKKANCKALRTSLVVVDQYRRVGHWRVALEFANEALGIAEKMPHNADRASTIEALRELKQEAESKITRSPTRLSRRESEILSTAVSINDDSHCRAKLYRLEHHYS
jgi:hypothetical protein